MINASYDHPIWDHMTLQVGPKALAKTIRTKPESHSMRNAIPVQIQYFSHAPRESYYLSIATGSQVVSGR